LKSTSLDASLQYAIKETSVIAKIIESGSTCLLCFVTNPFVIEWHHVGGRKNSSVLLPLCANCHLLASKNQQNYTQRWSEHNKPDYQKILFVLKDLQFLEQNCIQLMIENGKH
jgi:hypothetical protein